jgi:guanylate kinase
MEAAGKIPVLDIDVQGGVQVIDIFGPELVSVFLFPPSWDELERRLTSRGTDSEEVIATRLSNARHEVGLADRYTYWVVNDDLEEAVGKMRAIISAEESKKGHFGAPPVG